MPPSLLNQYAARRFGCIRYMVRLIRLLGSPLKRSAFRSAFSSRLALIRSTRDECSFIDLPLFVTCTFDLPAALRGRRDFEGFFTAMIGYVTTPSFAYQYSKSVSYNGIAKR